MSAQPARRLSDTQSHSPVKSSPVVGRVLQLHPERVSSCPAPDPNHHKSDQTRVVESGSNSGTRLTLRDIPGDWGSVTTVWTDSPPPLANITGEITAARQGQDPAAPAMAGWLLLTLIPRGGLHLLSWVLAHPARTAMFLLAAMVTWLLA